VELGHIEARLSEDTAQVEVRIAAIENGAPLQEDMAPELDEDELDARLTALQSNIPTRLAEIDILLNGDGTEENPGLLAEREAQLAELETALGLGYLPQLQENIDLAEENDFGLFITNYIGLSSNRLAQIEYGGSLASYVDTTLVHGRPGSGTVWNGNVMVAWSQRAGGPLRDDQIGDLVAFILNWDKGDDWTVDDFNAVGQYAIVHSAYDPDGGSGEDGVGVNVANIIAELPEGDATNGETLYNGSLGCVGCHVGGAVGPDVMGTWTRTLNDRLEDLEDYTGVQYLVESIVAPNAYIVDGYASGVMNNNYGDILTAQELADIVAYLQTQDQ
ncbi:MAG: cytochrome c, partial [Chloroflexota bacterium]